MRLAKSSKKETSASLTPPDVPSPTSSQELISLKSGQGHLSKKTAYGYTSRGPTTPSPEPTLSQDNAHITIPMFTVYSALFYNGVILGIPCATSAVSKSRPPAPHVPEPLRPLQVQLDQVHYSFIDRLPQKALRQKLVHLGDTFNVEDFTGDMFTMPTFIIAPGCQSWDPSGWTLAPEFRSKWRIIFDAMESSSAESVGSPGPQPSRAEF